MLFIVAVVTDLATVKAKLVKSFSFQPPCLERHRSTEPVLYHGNTVEDWLGSTQFFERNWAQSSSTAPKLPVGCAGCSESDTNNATPQPVHLASGGGDAPGEEAALSVWFGGDVRLLGSRRDSLPFPITGNWWDSAGWEGSGADCRAAEWIPCVAHGGRCGVEFVGLMAELWSRLWGGEYWRGNGAGGSVAVWGCQQFQLCKKQLEDPMDRAKGKVF